MSLLTHGFNGGQIEQVISNSNNRMDVINTIGNLKCNIGDYDNDNNDDEVHYERALETSLNALSGAAHYEQKKIVMFNMCGTSEADRIRMCDKPKTFDPNGKIEITTINVERGNNGQFGCVTTSSVENEFNFDYINSYQFTQKYPLIRDEICEKHTLKPTPKPTWYPTKKPTTPEPTWKPTPRPTWDTPNPTPRPTWYTPNPTRRPSEWQTPRPTWNPTPKPTLKPTKGYCDLKPQAFSQKLYVVF